MIGVTSIRIAHIRTKRSDLNLHAVRDHENDPKSRAHINTAGKELLNASRVGIRCDVIIFRLAAQDEIPHTAADQVRLEPGGMQAAADIGRKFSRSHDAIMRPSSYAKRDDSGFSATRAAALFWQQ